MTAGGANQETQAVLNAVFDPVNNALRVSSEGAATPSGPAGGDLSGTYPNPTVAKSSAATFAIGGATPVTVPVAAATDPIEALISVGVLAEGENWPLNLGTGILTATGTPAFAEISTRSDKTSGALTAFTLTTAAQQVDTGQDRVVAGSIINTSAASAVSLILQLSPDNVTYTGIGTIQMGGTTIDTIQMPFSVYVPKGWYLKASNLTNASATAGVAY